MRFLACIFFLACWHADAKRALKADLSTDADANDMGIPTGSGAHVGSCSPVNLDGGATGEQCSGKLWLRRDPGNTGYYKFKNANGKGMIGCVRCSTHAFLPLFNVPRHVYNISPHFSSFRFGNDWMIADGMFTVKRGTKENQSDSSCRR